MGLIVGTLQFLAVDETSANKGGLGRWARAAALSEAILENSLLHAARARVRSAYVARVHAAAKFFRNVRVIIEACFLFFTRAACSPPPSFPSLVRIAHRVLFALSLSLFLSLGLMLSMCTRGIYLYLGPLVFSTCCTAVQQAQPAVSLRKNRGRTRRGESAI